MLLMKELSQDHLDSAQSNIPTQTIDLSPHV